MTISPGSRLGPYEILAPLGVGGMGEVWRAKDTRLDRDVAIKILPQGFAADEKLLARFEREARAISKLSHPNVCTLFDVGKDETEGMHYLVMEHLEGESLADRVKKGPLPLNEVLRYGQQIASALDAAHRQGIVHRDLKPGNVMLTKSGAKLLDFGLAKTATEGQSPIEGLTNLPTEAKPLTKEGTILGTFQYMAPEQLEGLEADARTDIFALGAVLYEMATSHRAFSGSTKTSLIAAIVSSQPEPVSSVVAMSPPALDHIIRKCLEKDPDDRWQSAHDIAGELQWISEAGTQAGVATAITVRRKTRERLAWAAAVAVSIIATYFLATIGRSDSVAGDAASKRKIAFAVSPPSGHIAYGPRLTPDGQRLVYREDDEEGVSRLVVKELDDARSRSIQGTEYIWGYQGGVSPDGKSFAFVREGRLYKVPLDGGSPVRLSDFRMNPRGWMGWGRDGRIYLAPQDNAGTVVHAIPESGGDPVPVTTIEADELMHAHVFPLPDGRILFQVALADNADSRDREGINIATPGSGEKTLVMKVLGWIYAGGFVIRKAPESSKRLLFHRFDPATATTEAPVPVDFPVEVGSWTVSDNGIVAIQEPEAQVDSQLVWFDRNGNRLGSVGESAPFLSQPRLSRDGMFAAVKRWSEDPAERGLWVYDLSRGTRGRVAEGEDVYSPLWSPDGLNLYYLSAGTPNKVHRVRRDGVGQPETVVEGTIHPVDVSADGDLLYKEEGAEQDALKLLSPGEEGNARTLVTGELGRSAISPDGTMIAYQDGRVEPGQIYAVRTDGRGLRVQLSTAGGSNPRWTSDGKELFYFTPADKLMSVTIRSEGERIIASEPTELFKTATSRWNEFYDVTPDGQRFLVVVPLAEPTPRPIHVFVNWMPELFGK